MGFLTGIFSNKKEKQLFSHLKEAADYGLASSRILCSLCKNSSGKNEYCQQIQIIEHQCDQTVKQIHAILNGIFLLPFSHEEFEKLASHFDSIVDCVQGAVKRIVDLYGLPDIEKERELLGAAETLCMMTETILEITANLKNLKKVKRFSQRIDKLHDQENEIDDLCDKAKARWHRISQENTQMAPLRIAWVEIYEHLDWAGNRCLDAADIFGGILQRWG